MSQKIKIGDVRQIVKEALEEQLVKEETIHTADGKQYVGDRNKIEKVLVQYGSTGPERSAIMSGQIPIAQSALSALLRAKAVKGPPPREAKPKPYDWEKERNRRIRKRAAAENKFRAAVAKFARTWRGFTLDMPDVEPQDAAPDAAESFFITFPEWKEWLAAMQDPFDTQRVTKATMKEIIADYVYDEMLKPA